MQHHLIGSPRDRSAPSLRPPGAAAPRRRAWDRPEHDAPTIGSTVASRKRGPASRYADPCSLLRASARRQFWSQPQGGGGAPPPHPGLARVLARSPRLSASAALGRRRGLGGAATFASGGAGAVPANGPAANESWRPLVAPLAHIRDMGCGKLRVLSQNRASASRVPLCYGLSAFDNITQ